MWALFFGGIDERYYKINQIYGYFIYEKANRLALCWKIKKW